MSAYVVVLKREASGYICISLYIIFTKVSMNVSNCGRSECILRLKRSDYALEHLHMLYGNSYLEYAITQYCKQYT
jgi:uncharacterized membrane protein